MGNETENAMGTAYGVDGCKAGWFVVALKPSGEICWKIVEKLEELEREADRSDRIFVDIPIGLPPGREERPCDTGARRKLGSPRGSSVFPAPVREALSAKSYDEANKINRRVTDGKGVSKQTYSIMRKIKEVDDLLKSCEKARRIVREVHPEVCFWALAGERAMCHRKDEYLGHRERLAVLESVRPSVREEFEEIVESHKKNIRRREVESDDILDAMVAAVTASADSFQTLPDQPTRDGCGRKMEIVYASNHDIPNMNRP